MKSSTLCSLLSLSVYLHFLHLFLVFPFLPPSLPVPHWFVLSSVCVLLLFFYLLIFLLPASFVWFKLPFCFFFHLLACWCFFFLWVLLNWWNLTISSLLVFIIIKYIWNIASHPLSDVHRNEANRQKKEKALNRFLGHSQVRCGLFITAQHKMCVVQ